MAFNWRIHRRPKTRLAYDKNDKLAHVGYAGGAVVASAALVSKERVRTVVGRRADWQADSWDLYDTVPELRFGISWISNACSRARLYVGKIDPDGSSNPVPVDAQGHEGTPEAQAQAKAAPALLAPLQELGGGQLGQSEMLRRLAIHLNVPGESYVIGYDCPESGTRRWVVASSEEVTSSGGGIKLASQEIPNEQIDIDPDHATILRIWRPHPRLGHQADSPLMALRQPLRELIDISAHITATAESRLAGAGVLGVPDELTVPAPEQSEGANPLHSEPVTAALIEAMAAPLKNRDSASAVVPLVLRGPGEAVKNLTHFSFSTEFDANARELRESAIRRVATGLDMPPEVLLGMGQSNHWSAWQVEESAIKLHIEPLLGLICDSLTTYFYQPALRAMGVLGWEQYCLWFDTTELTLRTNRGPEAIQAYQQGLTGEAATRRELGFSDEDAPTEEERARNLATQVAMSNANLAPFLLPGLGVELPEGAEEQAQPEGTRAPLRGPGSNGTNTAPVVPGNPAPVAGRPGAPAVPQTPSTDTGRNEAPRQAATQARTRLATHPGGHPAAKPGDFATLWRARCLEFAVTRALQRSGNYLLATLKSRTVKAQFKHVPLHEMHLELPIQEENLDRALHNAYNEFHLVTPGEDCLHKAVDHYVRALLISGQPHHIDHLTYAISEFGCEQGQAA